ncbi:hypothetical protein JCGZ_10580 [Jatropha curcas]|uniref:Uncharacterized protein n=1 Tax=Jatropha curcas TaxID=180498 RepID=A0A067KRA0_JATCU|nr:hypothetical protein JCGZ_10580 [Jatropha curcas]
MASTGNFEIKAITFLVLALFSCLANGALSHTIVGLRNRRALGETSGAAITVFDVTEHGAKADDKTNNAMSFIQTWKAACASTAPAKVVIPDGTFLTGPTIFQGPCAGPVIFEVQGCVKASTDLSEYTSPEWMTFESIDGLTFTGKGTFSGQGPVVWEYNDCKSNEDCQKLPASLSVGSLGKYPDEDDVSGILVINCTFSNTTNGARIKTYSDSGPSNAFGIVYQDIIMNDVKNPIIIDQKYGIKDKEAQPSNSKVKVSDVHFKNIKGTSISAAAVDLQCSSAFPCEGVELSDIDLTYIGNEPSTESALCSNAKVTCDGIQNPAITCT